MAGQGHDRGLRGLVWSSVEAGLEHQVAVTNVGVAVRVRKRQRGVGSAGNYAVGARQGHWSLGIVWLKKGRTRRGLRNVRAM